MINKITALVLLIISVACTSKQAEIKVVTLPAINKSIGAVIHQTDKSKLRYGEALKAYSLGRSVDPLDNSVMHEAGILYRLESSSAWNLQPGLPLNMPYTEPEQKNQDNVEQLKAEIEVKANEQRALYNYLKQAADKASGQIDVLQESTAISHKLLAQNKLLKEKLSFSETQKIKLTEDLLKLKKQIAILLKFYQQKEADKIKSQFRRK
jgi:hypothetical protein